MLRAVILDDEERGSQLLARKLEHFKDELEVVAIYNDPYRALAKIEALEAQILFLDVEMPGLNGFEFLEKLGTFGFEVIFTTAYDSYTLEALRLSVVDYLVKPIDEDELQTAIFRLKKRVANRQRVATARSNGHRLALSTAEGVYFVDKTNIMRVEATSNYSTFVLKNHKNIMVSKTLKEFEMALEDADFIRVNRSVIVNLSYMEKYRKGDGGTIEMIDGAEIEVSASRKEALLQRLF